MAGILTHLIIAREMIKILPKGTIKNEGYFYAGSVAPDAIHAREGFIRADKKHTHLRDDIPDKDFHLEPYLELFHNRVSKFIKEHNDETKEDFDLYRGYVTHILTDELYMLTIRKKFVEVMGKEGISQDDKSFYQKILTDMNRIDFLLAKNYGEMKELKVCLEQFQPHQIKGYLSEKEIQDSFHWLFHRYFVDEYEVLEPVYMSYDEILEFIKMAVNDIIGRLSKGGSLPIMFY